MKVLYVLNSTLIHGGATKAFLALVNGLMHKGIIPVVVVPDKNGIYEQLQEKGIETIVLTYRPCIYPYWNCWKDYLLALPRMMARLAVNHRASRVLTSYLMQHDIDLVHTNVSVIDIGYRAAIAAGIPHVYHLREYGDKIHMYHFPSRAHFIKQLAKSWSVCITKDIQKHHGQDGNPKSVVIYDGIYNKRSNYVREEPDAPYYLFAGRVEPIKGLLSLLEAYSVDIPLKIAGAIKPSPYYNECCEVIRKRNLNAEFLGQCDNLPELQRRAIAQIVPSRFEGFGLCMPEGMFNGCLAIARNTGGSREQLDNGEALTGNIIGYRYDTQEELSELLHKVASLNEAEAEQMRQRAFYTVNNLYSVETDTDAVFALYKRIIDNEHSF